ncbi:uncharacterized protein A4U43_C03F16290 [Asparagus officinalis]|uniref:Pentacotripeptide-repeat region of PRORP domain-containing protein n=2 Tax=Asparagus officinalis TaxID=4686 RepID=A0A5P1FBF4_ASPOF|nr:uncharacterized protein A4U43_C03F16290 [Asparagus officinalis]
MEEERGGRCGPNVVSYTCLMRCLCESGRLEEALGVLDRMGLNGVEPNRVTLRTLLKGFCDKGRVDEAYRIVESMVGKERGISSRECYSVLVVCLLRAGDWEGAQGLFGRMLERGVRPDGVACNSVMREICKRRCFLDGYNWIGVLEEKGASFVDSDVYSCLLAGLCEEGHMVEAVKLGRKIVENGVRIEDACGDCIVEAMEKVGECHLASEILRMKEENKSELIEEN